MRKIVALVLAFVMVLSMTTIAWAAEGTITGTGTKEDPYVIANAADLAAFRNAVNSGTSYKGKFVALAADIDLEGAEWEPIGVDKNKPFQGTFDGQEHTISNLYFNNSEMSYVGLFGYAYGATIKNVNVENVDLTGYSYVGAITGRSYTGSISNCHVTGDIRIVSDYAYAGGITGGDYVALSDCSVIADGMGEITINQKTGAGGICGWHTEGNYLLSNLQVKNLNITAWTNLGGITGFVHYSNTIDGCSVENVNLTKTRDVGHPGFGIAAGGWSYNASKAITITNNSFKNITFNGTTVAKDSATILYGSEYSGKSTSNFVLSNNTVTGSITNNVVYTANDAAGLRAALEAGGSVVLGADVTVTFDGNPTIYVANGATVDGNGYTLTLEGSVGSYASNCAFDNLTSGEAVTFENMTVVNNLTSGYAFGFADAVFSNMKISGKTPFKPGNPIDADDALYLNNCEITDFDTAILTDGGPDTPVLIGSCTFTVDSPADHYAVILRNSGSSSVDSTYNAKINLYADDLAKNITGNTFNDRVKLYTEDEKLSGNTFGANGYVEIEDDVDASTIDLSANYWGGEAPAEDQIPEGAVVDTYYTIVKADGSFDGLTSATGEDVKIPEHSTTTTEKPTESDKIVVEATTTVSSTTIETMVENNQGMVVEAPVDSAVTEVTDSVVVSFDAKATETLAEMADDIEVVITATTKEAAVEAEIITEEQASTINEKEVEVAVVLTADILVNGKKEAFVTKGGVEIEVPFAPADGNQLTDYVVYFLNDNGSLAKVPTDYVDGKLVVTLQHFSTYIIGTQPVCDCALADAHLVPGDIINLPNPTAKNYTVSAKWKYGKSMVEDIKWNKDAGMWQIILKENYTLSEERELKGTLTFKGTGSNRGASATVTVDEVVCNHIQYIWGEKKAKDVTDVLDTTDAPLLIMDEDGGYVKFENELLSGLVKMDKNEKTFLNIIYGYVEDVTEDTIDAFEAFVGEDYIDDAIIEYYTFEGTNPFKNEVAFSYEAYVEDPHYFYQWKDGQLTKFDVKYNDDEEVEAWQWNAIADGTIIVTDVEIVLSAETSKNPNTGACTNNVASMAAALAVSFMVAAGAVALKK